MANISLLLLLFLLLISTTISGNTDTFIFAGCSQFKYDDNSPYASNVNSLLSSLVSSASTSSSNYNKLTSTSASTTAPVYGVYQCRGDVSMPDCGSCVHSSVSQLPTYCPSAEAATIQLDGCMIRYGNDSFVGKLDENLLYHTCGPFPNNGYNAELMAMRDDALNALVSSGGTGGTYRNGAAGTVQAAAQCVGDISPKDCSDCITAAVGQVKAICGNAVSGDVYLAKCFAKYDSSGYPSSPSNPSPSGYTPNSDNTHKDESGKTVAIIIGLMAAIALIIIFLSFVKRNGSSGKS